MSTEMVQVFMRRPPFVAEPTKAAAFHFWKDGHQTIGKHGPVVTCVSVHDQYFITVRSAYKRMVKKSLSVETVDAYRRWQERERQWYRVHGLLPPGVHRARRHGSTLRPTCKRGHVYDSVVGRKAQRWCHQCAAVRRSLGAKR